MKVKYEYRVAIQEARATRCNKLKELEAAYLETISENVAVKSLQCAADYSEHARLIHELERWALDVENKSHQDFLLGHQCVLHHAPQSLKKNLHSSYHILLGQSSSSFQYIPSARAPQTGRQPPAITSPKPEPTWSPLPKRQHSSTDAQGDMSGDENFPMASQEGPSSSKIGKMADWFSSLSPSYVDAFGQDSSLMKEARAHYFTTHPWDWAHSNMDDLSRFSRSWHKVLACWGSPFMNYNGHGMDWRT